MSENTINPNEVTNGVTPQALTEDLLQQVNGGDTSGWTCHKETIEGFTFTICTKG